MIRHDWIQLGKSAVAAFFTPPPIIAVLQKLPGLAIVLIASYWPGRLAAASLAVILLGWHLIGIPIWSSRVAEASRRDALPVQGTARDPREVHFIFWSTLLGIALYATLVGMIVTSAEPLYSQF
ncbi:MAG: hypothetical protein WEG36_05885 [Gemmatimonadota bacterium]